MVILWDSLPSASEEAPICGSTACEFADSLYVFGGWAQDPGAPAHEMRHCVFDMNTEQWLPQEALDVDGDIPTPRAGCSVARIRGTIYLFGGQQHWPSELMDDFYAGSIVQPGVVSWDTIAVDADGTMVASRRPSMAPSMVPSHTSEHSQHQTTEAENALADGEDELEEPVEHTDDNMSVRSAGEDTQSQAQSSVHEPASPKTQPLKQGKVLQPPARAWHASCTMEDEDGMAVVVICGGVSTNKQEGGLCDDLWSFNPKVRRWDLHTPPKKKKTPKSVKGKSPLPRAFHTLTQVGRGIEAVMFGGRTPQGDHSNDVFVLNALNWTWSQVSTPAPPPSPKGGSSVGFRRESSIGFASVGDGGSMASIDSGSRHFVPCTGPLACSWHGAASVFMPTSVLELGYSEEELEAVEFYEPESESEAEGDDGSHQPSANGSVKSGSVDHSVKPPPKPAKLWEQKKGSDSTKVEVLLIFGGMVEPPPFSSGSSVSVGSASNTLVSPSVPTSTPLYALDRQSRWHSVNTLDCRSSNPAPVRGGPVGRSGSVFVSTEDKTHVVLVGGTVPASQVKPKGTNSQGEGATPGGSGAAAVLAMKSSRSAKKMERLGDAMVLRMFADSPGSGDVENEVDLGLVRNMTKKKGLKKKGPQTVKLNLEDGGVYEGFVNAKGKKEGKGKIIYGLSGPNNGSVYEGMFDDDVRSGQGVCRYGDGRIYDGNWTADEPSGSGQMTYPVDKAGDRSPMQYNGVWRRGVKHGNGILTFKDGSELESTWRNGKLKTDNDTKLITYALDVNNEKVQASVITNCVFDEEDRLASGTETCAAEPCGGCEEYEGSFNLKGERHGEMGVCVYADGSVYRGSWRNGRRNGRGSMEDSRTKELYDGKWVGGERLGRGVCTYPAGHRYEGTWANNLRDGVGVYYHSNGESYDGEWKSGARHGYGVVTDARGRVMRGWFKNDQLVEEDVRGAQTVKNFELDDDLASLNAPSVSSLTSYDFNADIAIALE